jgi:hypothetical protein
MITKQELENAISQLEQLPPTLSNCEKLATYYTIYDHIYGEQPQTLFSKASTTVDIYGNNPIVQAVNGKDQVKVWDVIQELMEAIQVLAPNLYDATLDKLNDI